jgi:hypothetical protein
MIATTAYQPISDRLLKGPPMLPWARGVERLQVSGLTELFALRLDDLDVECDAHRMRLET